MFLAAPTHGDASAATFSPPVFASWSLMLFILVILAAVVVLWRSRSAAGIVFVGLAATMVMGVIAYNRHAATMPRTMLRYAIERLPATKRRLWMGKATKDTR